jgi:hypothetical protein
VTALVATASAQTSLHFPLTSLFSRNKSFSYSKGRQKETTVLKQLPLLLHRAF